MKYYKPVTPVLRHRIITSRKNLAKKRYADFEFPIIKKKSGRNHHGRITVRRRGGRVKRRYRNIDFKRSQSAIKIIQFEYDPNRTAHIALAKNLDNTGAHYILAPDTIKEGDILYTHSKNPYKIGNTMQLRDIPIGIQIHNLELYPGRGGQMIRSAGTFGKVTLHNSKGYVGVELPSGEQRLFNEKCVATIGSVSNSTHHRQQIGGAGYNRYRGIRPHVRGVAMNPIDHPHGGGEGKTSGGRPSVTPWGRLTKGYKTVKNKNKWIIKKT